MMIDLTRTPLSELLQMQEQLPAEIQRRRSLEREQVMKELSALARARGFVLEDLTGGQAASAGKPQVVAPKQPARMSQRTALPELPEGRRRRSPAVKHPRPMPCDLT
jgi:hypothetical protein